MGDEDVVEPEDTPRSALLLTNTEWTTLRDIVLVFRKSGHYESPERGSLIDRILECTE